MDRHFKLRNAPFDYHRHGAADYRCFFGHWRQVNIDCFAVEIDNACSNDAHFRSVKENGFLLHDTVLDRKPGNHAIDQRRIAITSHRGIQQANRPQVKSAGFKIFWPYSHADFAVGRC